MNIKEKQKLSSILKNRQLEFRLADLQTNLNSRTLELAKIRETWERDENAIREKVQKELQEMYDKQTEERRIMIDEERAELFQEINELKEALEHYKTVATNYYEASFDEQWPRMKDINKELEEIGENNELIQQMLNDINEKRKLLEDEEVTFNIL